MTHIQNNMNEYREQTVANRRPIHSGCFARKHDVDSRLRAKPARIMFGEGVATKRNSLVEEFGAQRVRNTPLAEGIIAGTGAGAAATGLRPFIATLMCSNPSPSG
jgi:hypothetical protein